MRILSNSVFASFLVTHLIFCEHLSYSFCEHLSYSC